MVHQHGDHHNIPSHSQVKRVGGWLPTDHRIHQEWLGRTIDRAHQRHGPPEQAKLIPVLQEFKDLIENNSRIYMYFNQMWDEVPRRPPYNKDPTGKSQIRDYKHMLAVLNEVFGRAPEWTDAAAHAGMVGVPMAAIFDYAMGTPSGHAAFLDPDVNKMLKKILNEWGKFLKTPESAQVLGDHSAGWFGETGYKDLMEVANVPRQTSFKFEEMYQCDPSAKRYGFQSWDDFFTRRITDHSRPVASPSDQNVVVNSCESRPYCVAKDVRLRDKFWVKGQPYSVIDMLAKDPLAAQFEGGTIYQAFLSALSYHRWHSPVSGTIRRAFVEDGTYFSEPLIFETTSDGGEAATLDIDTRGIQGALGYLTALATRAIIFVEADNPKIGLMCFVGVGMDEVSTCDITVKDGQRVEKGEEIGMFHFGGSTYCLLFRKETKLGGWPDTGQYKEKNVNFPVRGQLAVVEE